MEKNGIIVPYGDNGARHGDLWMCSKCGTAIVRGFGEPAWQPKVKARMRLSDRNILKGIKDGSKHSKPSPNVDSRGRPTDQYLEGESTGTEEAER